jgi:hypothetical protein
MTRGTRNGLILAATHLAIVGSLGVKLLADRAMLPRAWVRAAPVDPNLPIRGRHVQIRPEVDRFEKMEMAPSANSRPSRPVRLESRNGLLFAAGSAVDNGVWGSLMKRPDWEVVRLDPVAFFIPESVADPSIRKAGEELWVEVTIPRAGPPRPIRLGVKRDGVLTPLASRWPSRACRSAAPPGGKWRSDTLRG